MAAVITFDIAAFRAAFPAFADEVTYPDEMLESYWDAAVCYISDLNYGRLTDGRRERAIWLMLAHLITLSAQVQAGQVPGLMQSATVDRVSVSTVPPPVKSQWSWWLSLTGYGQQLLALLGGAAAGGFFVGGLPERSALRKWAGLF